jgi:hypothetical protein
VKKHYRSGEVTRGAGAAKLIAKAVPKVSKVTIKTRSMVWDWTPNTGNPWSNMVFVVVSNTVPSTPRSAWPVYAVVTTNSCPLKINPSVPQVFFFVFASNTVTGYVSP